METIGELRAFLRETNATWQVDPSYADSDPIPKFPTGGLASEQLAMTDPDKLRALRSIVGGPKGPREQGAR